MKFIKPKTTLKKYLKYVCLKEFKKCFVLILYFVFSQLEKLCVLEKNIHTISTKINNLAVTRKKIIAEISKQENENKNRTDQ